ncbi:MAG: TonB family protein [Polyangiaceae bacterium]
MRRAVRACVVAGLLLGLAAISPVAQAQTTPDQPSGGAIPSGASGAIATPADSSQPATPPTQTVLVPPKVIHDEGAEYPQAALQEHFKASVDVKLVLDIDATGAVTKAAVEGEPIGHGFDEAAIAAAMKLKYSPATRNGQAIPARFRHAYHFDPPQSQLVGKVLSSASDSPIANAEITVEASDGTKQQTTTDAKGAWTIANLKFGTYRISVKAERFAGVTVEQSVEPGEEVGNTLRLDPTGKRVVLGAPVKGPNDEDVDEVTVHGQKPPREVVKRTLERRELERIPGTNGDAVKSIQNMPGVARAPFGGGLLVVRGSNPQDTQVFVDGTAIPLVYHFGGLSSVVPTELIEKLDFYPGNFSAEYGRGMGGIVDVGIRNPKKDKLHGMAQVDFIDLRAVVEGPIFNTGWSFALAGRRSYFDLWLKPVLSATGAGVTVAPVYYDYQAMVQKDFDSHRSFRLLFFGSDDRLDLLIKSANASDPALAGGIGAHTGFFRVQGRYVDKLSKDTEFRLLTAVGQDYIDFNLGPNFATISDYPISGRAEVAQKITTGVILNAGLDMLYAPFDVDVRFPPFPKPGQPPPGPGLAQPSVETQVSDAVYEPAAYLEGEITPLRGTRIVPGVRLDYTKATKQWDLAPRVNARQDLTKGFPKTTLKAAAGLFFQPPQPQETDAVFGQVGLVSNRAYQYDVGVEQDFTRQIDVSLDGWYKQLDQLVINGALNQGRGRAYGLETLIRYKPDAHFFGWIAYTLSRSERQDTPELPVHLAQYDQTHILTILGSYRLGRGWEFGARFRLVSGDLYSPLNYGFFDENNGATLPLQSYPPYTSRLPVFHQLDLRVDKTWKFTHWQLSSYLDVQNVYNQGNVEGISNNYNFTKSVYAQGLPFLPSLGLRAEF